LDCYWSTCVLWRSKCVVVVDDDDDDDDDANDDDDDGDHDGDQSI
jgi:hypothetical protein